MGNLPWFKKGDYYYDVLKDKLMYLSEGGEPVFATYLFDSVDAGKESAWIRMDENATDLETDKEYLFFQHFVGVEKAGLVYVQYPLGEEIYTTDKLVPDTSKGEEFAYIDNKVSPFNDPDESTEFFIVKGVTIAFKYYNNQPFALRQKLRFVGKKFKQEEIEKNKPHPVTKEIVSEAMYNELKKTARPLYMRRVS
jgi:hypothetical protein